MDLSLLTTLADMLGPWLYKAFGRAKLKARLLDKKQLVVVQPDHWLMDVLCEWTRDNHEQLQSQPVGDRIPYVQTLLAKRQDAAVGSEADATSISIATVAVASFYSHLWADVEPLLIEVALTECLATFPLGDPSDVDGFETFLHKTLHADRAVDYFGCQYFIDSADLLALSPYFYKTKISNPVVQELIARCIVESCGDQRVRDELLVDRLVEKKNRAALDGWTAWLGEEIATVGWPQRITGDQRFRFLHDFVLNAKELHPDKPAYFPIEVGLREAPTASVRLHQRGVISPSVKPESCYLPGFIYFAPGPETKSASVRL